MAELTQRVSSQLGGSHFAPMRLLQVSASLLLLLTAATGCNGCGEETAVPFKRGSFEPNEFAFLDRALKPGMVFVDVGANDGYFTTFAACKVGSAGGMNAKRDCERIGLR